MYKRAINRFVCFSRLIYRPQIDTSWARAETYACKIERFFFFFFEEFFADNLFAIFVLI